MAFVNLGMAVGRLETEFQYAPEIATHRSDFRNVVNSAYQALAREERWTWLWDSRPVLALPDLTFATGASGVQLVGGGGPRSFQVVRTALQAAIGASTPLTPAILEAMLNGMVTTGSATKTLGTGNWEEGPFSIERVDNPSPDTAWTQLTFDLDPACKITALTGTEGGIVMSFPRIALPLECDALVCVRDQNGVPLTALTPREAREKLWVRTTSGSTPAFCLEDQGFELPDPRIFQLTNTRGGMHPRGSPFVHQRENWPFRDSFAVTNNGGSGSFTVGQQVRVFCSWYWGGRFGPPSSVVSFTVGSQRSVLLEGLPTLPQTTVTNEYGRRIAVFIAEGEGAFFFRGFQTSPIGTTYGVLTPSTDRSDADVGLRMLRWDEVFGSYKYLRLYPEVSGFVRLTAEYWRAPRQLVEDVDAPEFDQAFHDLIVWRACLDLGTRPGMSADNAMQRYQLNYDRQFAAYATKYLPSEKLVGSQKGMIGQQSRKAPLFRTVDWHGDS